MRVLARSIGAVLLCAPLAASAVPVHHVFDAVSSFTLGEVTNSVTGVERGTGNPLTVSFIEQTNESYQFQVSRCVPVLLTMIEKPGRYYLTLTIDSARSNLQLQSCTLSLRT